MASTGHNNKKINMAAVFMTFWDFMSNYVRFNNDNKYPKEIREALHKHYVAIHQHEASIKVHKKAINDIKEKYLNSL